MRGRLTGRKKEILGRQAEIERSAGVELFNSGKCDWEKYRQSKNDLAAANPEYKALQDELDAIRAREMEREIAQRDHVVGIRYHFRAVMRTAGLSDDQMVALRVAYELLSSCKDGAVVRAEKRAKKEAAEYEPSFRPASWQNNRKSKKVSA